MIYDVGLIPLGHRFGVRRGPGRVQRDLRRRIGGEITRSRLLMDDHDKAGLGCRVVDVSRYGCRVALHAPERTHSLRKVGFECILELADGTWLQVRVCWFAAPHVGLKVVRRIRKAKQAVAFV